jgi:hypothetical protein
MGVECIGNREETIESRHSEMGAQYLRQQTADQQTADSRQQTADSRQQTADSRQQTADSRKENSRQQTEGLVVPARAVISSVKGSGVPWELSIIKRNKQ